MLDEGAENLVWAWKGCAAMLDEGGKVTSLVRARKCCAAMRDEGAESVKFSVGSEGLCRNAGRGRGKCQI